jgi:hypothetical protein
MLKKPKKYIMLGIDGKIANKYLKDTKNAGKLN